MADHDTDYPVSATKALDQDWLLENIVHYANIGVGQSITLFIGGSVVSGETISAIDYLEEMAKRAENSPLNAPEYKIVVEKIAEGYRTFKAMYQKPHDAGEDWEPPKIGFIHLKNAKVFTANGTVPNRGDFLWRGRISCIDAWSLGGLAA